MCRYCVTENNLDQKRGFACGASRHVVLHRMSERVKPVAVKAKPYGRCAALPGLAPQKHPRNTVAASAISGKPNARRCYSGPTGERSKIDEVGRRYATALS